ncbi:MAG: hypothetical protein ACH349_06795 [Candidatus Rhabdochlamydia sp.]
MMMKNKQMLKGIICNSLLLLTLAQGNASDLNKEDLDKSRPYQFSSEYKAIARKYGRDYDKIRAPRSSTGLGRTAQEFREKSHDLLVEIQNQNEQQSKMGKAVVGTLVEATKEEVGKKVENNTLKTATLNVLDIMAESLINFFFNDPKEK